MRRLPADSHVTGGRRAIRMSDMGLGLRDGGLEAGVFENQNGFVVDFLRLFKMTGADEGFDEAADLTDKGVRLYFQTYFATIETRMLRHGREV